MANVPVFESSEIFLRSLESLQKLRAFEGTVTEFWQSYLNLLVQVSGSSSGLIALRGESSGWQSLAFGPQGRRTGDADARVLIENLDAAVQSGAATQSGVAAESGVATQSGAAAESASTQKSSWLF